MVWVVRYIANNAMLIFIVATKNVRSVPMIIFTLGGVAHAVINLLQQMTDVTIIIRKHMIQMVVISKHRQIRSILGNIKLIS